MPKDLVVVTGGSGFVGSQIVARLLREGYRVRTTVRSLDREPAVRDMITQAGVKERDALSFAVAELTSDEGWQAAVRGAKYVLHLASPVPTRMPKDKDALIAPIRGGTLRVLQAAQDAGIERFVLTSSWAAISTKQVLADQVIDETNWGDPDDPHVNAYQRAKILAERAAWDFVAKQSNNVELAVINPPAVYGPILGRTISTASLMGLQNIMNGKAPVLPKISFGIVDVRDVADLHVAAMTHPAAKDQRFLANSGDFVSLNQFADMVKCHMGAAGKRVSTRQLPDWAARLLGKFDSSLDQMLPQLGEARKVSNQKARTFLSWNPRSNEEAVLASAESLVRLGLVTL